MALTDRYSEKFKSLTFAGIGEGILEIVISSP